MICTKTNSLLVVNKLGVLVGRVQSLDLLWQIKPGYLDSEFAALTAHFVDEDSFKDACVESQNIPLEQFMEKNPKTVSPDTPLMEAAMIAIEDKHARIPVVDKNNVPVGIVTRTELKKMMGYYLELGDCVEGVRETFSLGTGKSEPLTTLLLPLAGNDIDKRIVKFAGCLAAALVDRAQSMTMLHVTGEGFLKRHLDKAASRRVKGAIVESGIFQNSRKRQIAEVVQPMLDNTEADLKGYGVTCPVRQKVVDGDYAQQILQVAHEGGFSTIVMGRRGLSLVSEIFKGSVSAEVLHQPYGGAIYIVGEKFTAEGQCPVSKILIPVDGSSYALAAVQEAAALSSQLGSNIASIDLLRVIDISKNPEKTAELDQDAERVLNEARQILLDAGVDEQKIVSRAHYGTPADSILATSVETDANLIMIGRRGRSAAKELLMGSVSSAVLHRCGGSTVAIISSPVDHAE
ncbi:MAG: universal stress protein [Desulfuromonas sp.]|nr:universal stress protein [Desulfuromonas sp.]